ncbi:MAG: helix-turn-helix domain-containing protein [Candidatus Woesearchaeota archaeon]
MNAAETLVSLGLTDKESQVYLALLPLGEVPLQEIAKRVSLPRTTIYNTLNYLANRGYVSFIVKKGVRFYLAAEPRRIQDSIKEKEALFSAVLPELSALKSVLVKPSKVEMYQGSKGLFTILSDVFKKKQMTYYFGSYSMSVEVLKHQPGHFRSLRLDRKIPAKIVIDNYDEEVFHSSAYKKITEMRFNKALKDFPCMVFIYGDKVAMYTLKKDLVGMIIQNEQFAQAMKMVFNMYWEPAEH